MSLSGVDYLVIGAYLVAITAFGSWFARFQKTTRDYFLTDRSVPWWAICFTIVATEADWPDAARIHRHTKALAARPAPSWQAFARFPHWMWRNAEVLELVDWLRAWNARHPPVGFYGLDLYSLYRSIHLVLEYLDRVRVTRRAGNDRLVL